MNIAIEIFVQVLESSLPKKLASCSSASPRERIPLTTSWNDFGEGRGCRLFRIDPLRSHFHGTVQQIIFANSIDILESFGEVFEDNANTVGVDETVIGEGVNGRTGRSSASSSASDVWRRLGVLMFIPVRIVSEPTMILGKPMMLAVITTAILEPSMLLDL